MRPVNVIIIILSVILLFAAAALYISYSFFSAFAPASVKITEDYISTNRNFINGVTIEKIKVDSMGVENYPVKYTVTYWTSCFIDHPNDRQPNPPNKIYFSKVGQYWWTEEKVNIPFFHSGFSRQTTDSTHRITGSTGTHRFKTCPIKLEKEQWYFVILGDSQITGIFFFIDKDGKRYQYTLKSGVPSI